jgi:hypothetical protein
MHTTCFSNNIHHAGTISLCEQEIPVYRVRVMVFNATFNNISVISWKLDECNNILNLIPRVVSRRKLKILNLVNKNEFILDNYNTGILVFLAHKD